MNLSQIMSIENLNKFISDGYISKRKHPEYDLWVLNYTNKTQFDNLWTPETEYCRGLVVDSENNIVLRSFRKFMNYEQVLDKIPYGEDFELYQKMDGSLFEVTTWKNNLITCTRGSFESPQCEWGRNLIEKRYKDFDFKEGMSYSFEVIFRANKIVINYSFEDIVLLAIFNTETGKRLSLPDQNDVPFRIVRKYDGLHDFKELQKLNIENEEGYVAIFKSGFMCKIKFENYCTLHKVLTNINERTIWECLSTGIGKEKIIENLDDEYFKWFVEVERDLISSYNCTESVAKMMFKDAWEYADNLNDEKNHRKNFAEFVKKCESKIYCSICFQMYGKMDYKDVIWKSLEPKGNNKFKIVSEEGEE